MKTVFARELQEIENVSEPTLGAIEELGRKTENGYNTWRKSGFFFTSSPGCFSLALEVGREKRPGDEVATCCAFYKPVLQWCNPRAMMVLLLRNFIQSEVSTHATFSTFLIIKSIAYCFRFR